MARVIPALLVILGLLQGVQGGWIYTKAWLAGFLVDQAWTRTRVGYPCMAALSYFIFQRFEVELWTH